MDPAHASVRIGGYRVLHAGLWVILHDCANHGAGDGSELVEGKDMRCYMQCMGRGRFYNNTMHQRRKNQSFVT